VVILGYRPTDRFRKKFWSALIHSPSGRRFRSLRNNKKGFKNYCARRKKNLMSLRLHVSLERQPCWSPLAHKPCRKAGPKAENKQSSMFSWTTWHKIQSRDPSRIPCLCWGTKMIDHFHAPDWHLDLSHSLSNCWQVEAHKVQDLPMYMYRLLSVLQLLSWGDYSW